LKDVDIYDSQSEYAQYKRNKTKIVNLTNPVSKEDNTQTIKPKHGGGTGQQIGKFFIRPLSIRRRKRASSLEEEDLDLLGAAFGTNGEGVTLVDSRESTLDQGGWH
jgi:hypothetical protein